MLLSLLTTSPFLFLLLISALILALSVHEFAHAYVASLLGDPTARLEGRLTLRPMAHLDPFGLLMLVFAGFGWARPVPVNPIYFKSPRRDMALVALAGPMSNLLLAFLGALLLHTPFVTGTYLQLFFYFFALYNINLAVFNVLPLDPLDGYKIVLGLLPQDLALRWAETKRYGTILLVVLFFTNGFDVLISPLVGFFTRLFGLY